MLRKSAKGAELREAAVQNELAILEFIHCLVETLDRYFGNVCELDLMFNLEMVQPSPFAAPPFATITTRKLFSPVRQWRLVFLCSTVVCCITECRTELAWHLSWHCCGFIPCRVQCYCCALDAI